MEPGERTLTCNSEALLSSGLTSLTSMVKQTSLTSMVNGTSTSPSVRGEGLHF